MSIFTDYIGSVKGVLDVVYKSNNIPWIGSVHCDACVSEIHSETGEATEHPVEKGSNISDHYRANPRTVRIEGFITNTPIRKPLSQADGVQEVDVEFTWEEDVAISGIVGLGVNAIASAVGATSKRGKARGFEPEFDRVADCWAELSDIVQKGKVVDIITSLKAYDNMVIESLEATDIKSEIRNKKTFLLSISFSAIAKQIRTVSTGFDDAPEPEPTTNRAKPTTSTGKKATKALEDGSAAKQKSLLKKGKTTFFEG